MLFSPRGFYAHTPANFEYKYFMFPILSLKEIVTMFKISAILREERAMSQ